MGTWFLIMIMVTPMGEIQSSIYNPTDYKSNNRESCEHNGDELTKKIQERFGPSILVSHTCREVKYEDIVKGLPPTL